MVKGSDECGDGKVKCICFVSGKVRLTCLVADRSCWVAGPRGGVGLSLSRNGVRRVCNTANLRHYQQ